MSLDRYWIVNMYVTFERSILKLLDRQYIRDLSKEYIITNCFVLSGERMDHWYFKETFTISSTTSKEYD